MNDVRNVWLLKHKTYRLKHRDKNKEKSINKEKTMKCIVSVHISLRKCHVSTIFRLYHFPNVLSENRDNTHLNHIYKGVSIVFFFLHFYCFY